MATYTLKEIVGLFKSGKSLDGIVALEAYEASVSAGRLRGAKKKSEARAMAARENGKKGGRPPSDPEAAKRRWEARQGRGTEGVLLAEENHCGSMGATPVVDAAEWGRAMAAGVRSDGEYAKAAADHKAKLMSANFTKPPLVVHAVKPAAQVAIKLPPGVMKGSEMEGRG